MDSISFLKIQSNIFLHLQHPSMHHNKVRRVSARASYIKCPNIDATGRRLCCPLLAALYTFLSRFIKGAAGGNIY